MSQKKKRNPFDLTDSEIDAILCALSTIDAFPCDSAAQMQLNLLCRDAAAYKLSARRPDYSANEIRTISCAIDGVILYLSGSYPEVILEDEVRKEISKNLFVYNRLGLQFRKRMYEFGVKNI